MNSNCKTKSLLIQLFNRRCSTFGIKRPNVRYSQETKSSIKQATPLPTINSKHEDKNKNVYGNRSENKDIKFKQFLTSDRHNPDNFGTLSDDWLIQQQLKALPEEEDDIVVTEFLHNRENKTRLTTNQYGRIIKQFLGQNKVAQAIEVLETRMKDDRVKPENYIYNLLIGACGRVGYHKKAFHLYKKMRDHGLKVTGHTYTGLFNACANSPFPEDALLRAQHLRLTLVERGFLMNQTLYHVMIKAFGRLGDMETAFSLVDEMIEKKIMVSEGTFNFLLQACITDKNTGFKQALLVWRKMMEKRVKPGLFTFNLMLRCSRDCGMGDEDSTLQLIQVLLQAGKFQTSPARLQLAAPAVNADTDSSNTSQNVPNLISPTPSMGDVMVVKSITSPEHRLMLMGGSKGVLKLMDMFRVKPDIKTFTQLLDQIPPTLAAETDLISQIKQAKIPVDCDFCNMLIRKRALRGDYENAKLALRLLQEENLKPNVMTFGVLAMACQDLPSARQLLDDIDKLNYCPNIEILGTLVKNACFRRDCDFIIEIMKTVEKVDLKPNDKFLKHIDNFYRFASSVLNKQLTDDTGVLNGEKFDEFCKVYRVWRRKMRPDDPPHPWEQFKNKDFEPEDLELLKYGKVKYSKKVGP